MSRRLLVRVSLCALACGFSALHGCRVGYELLPDGGRGANAGTSAGGGVAQAGDDAGGSDRGGASTGGASAGSGAGPAAGEGGVSSSSAAGHAGDDASPAGAAGIGAGGEPTVGSLPPLPCTEPLVWATDFSSDPTALDDNGDAQPDWVIRGGQPFVPAELVAGTWRPTTSKALDTSPPVNFTGRTQARVRMRDTNRVPPSVPTSFGGALFWINLDYQASDFLAIYGSVTTADGAAYELGVFARTAGPTETLGGPHAVTTDAFVVLELDFDPASGAVAAWVDGAQLPLAVPSRQSVLNSDQWATVIAPQGTGEFDDLWVATCRP
jgi:hypothetical protein